MPTLTARTLVTAIGTVAYPAITIGPTGLIEDISSDPTIRSEAILTPTFFDVHIQRRAPAIDVMHTTPAGMADPAAAFSQARGTSHYLPTTVTASVDDTLHALEALAQYRLKFPTLANDQAIPYRHPPRRPVPVACQARRPPHQTCSSAPRPSSSTASSKPPAAKSSS